MLPLKELESALIRHHSNTRFSFCKRECVPLDFEVAVEQAEQHALV